MRLLPDTHLWLWFLQGDRRLKAPARELMLDQQNEVLFSSVVIWETAIKFALGKPDFTIDSRVVRDELVYQGFQELTIDSRHAVAVADLPMLHHDPFDRLLIAQARVEGITLLTSDQTVRKYPGTRYV